jgi:hypothetical protein
LNSRLWEHGIYVLQDRARGYGMLGLASEGDVFLHGVRATSGSMLAWVEMRGAVTLDDIAAWARGVSQDQALQRWHQGIEAIMQAESRHGADDEAFW